MYLYESHQGDGIFASDERLTWDDVYCEICGDIDWELGNFDNVEDALEYMSDQIAVRPGDGGYKLDAILENLNAIFGENVAKDDARDIILKDRAKWE